MKKLTNGLLKLGDKVKEQMVENLRANGSYVTGDLANSIGYEVRIKGFQLQLVRTMLKYGEYVDQGIGRGPGKQPPVQDIIDWIKLKKIPVPSGMKVENFAFAIAKKIGERGTDPRPKPFIAVSLNQVLKETGKEIMQENAVKEAEVMVNDSLESVKFEG